MSALRHRFISLETVVHGLLVRHSTNAPDRPQRHRRRVVEDACRKQTISQATFYTWRDLSLVGATEADG